MDDRTDQGSAHALGPLEEWGAPLDPGPTPPSAAAWYLTKWRRRLPKVVIALALPLLVGELLVLATWRYADIGLSSMQEAWAPVVAVVGTLMACAVVLTTFVAGVWGRQVTADRRRRSARRNWLVASSLLVLLAVLTAWLVRPPGYAAPRTVATEKEGCHVYLAVIEESAQEQASLVGLGRYLRPLEAAAAGDAPDLARDLQLYFDDEGGAGFDAANRAVIGRCSKAGWLSMDDLQDHDERLQQITGQQA